MLRTITMLAIATLLSGCTTVFVPVPVPVNDRDINAFKAKYGALDEPYRALSTHLDPMAFAAQEWRAETVRMAQEWRTAIDDLRGMKQPHGDLWEKAWPVLMQAMDEYAYAAGAVENAASMNDSSLLAPVRALINGVNLTGEAMRLLKDK